VRRKRPELWPNDWIPHHDNAPALKALSVKQFQAQKCITEMEHPPCSRDLSPNDFWLFPKLKCILKGRRFQDTEDIPPPPKKKCDGTESYSTTGVPDSGNIVGLNAMLTNGSASKMTFLSEPEVYRYAACNIIPGTSQPHLVN
jgi:hypothetical protein